MDEGPLPGDTKRPVGSNKESEVQRVGLGPLRAPTSVDDRSRRYCAVQRAPG